MPKNGLISNILKRYKLTASVNAKKLFQQSPRTFSTLKKVREDYRPEFDYAGGVRARGTTAWCGHLICAGLQLEDPLCHRHPLDVCLRSLGLWFWSGAVHVPASDGKTSISTHWKIFIITTILGTYMGDIYQYFR